MRPDNLHQEKAKLSLKVVTSGFSLSLPFSLGKHSTIVIHLRWYTWDTKPCVKWVIFGEAFPYFIFICVLALQSHIQSASGQVQSLPLPPPKRKSSLCVPYHSQEETEIIFLSLQEEKLWVEAHTDKGSCKCESFSWSPYSCSSVTVDAPHSGAVAQFSVCTWSHFLICKCTAIPNLWNSEQDLAGKNSYVQI